MPYQYDTLPRGRWFRILKIHPGHFEDPLSCELVSTALDEAPQYRALSYVWGDPGAVASITCSGFKRKITVSLFEGLRRIRNTNNVEIAWADAICINQADNEEKSFQVNQMGDIYDKAAEVVVWLGHDVDGAAEVAFQGLRQVNKLLRDGTDTVWSPVSTEEVDVVIRESDPFKMFGPTMVRRSVLPTILDLDVSNAIKKIYQLPWFTRVWILQEVGLATIATAFWGSSHVDFGEIGEFIYFAMVYKNLQDILRQDIKDIISGSPYYAFHNVWSTYDKQNSWVSRSSVLSSHVAWMKESMKIDFVLVLEASRKLNATNCLDHVTIRVSGPPQGIATRHGQDSDPGRLQHRPGNTSSLACLQARRSIAQFPRSGSEPGRRPRTEKRETVVDSAVAHRQTRSTECILGSLGYQSPRTGTPNRKGRRECVRQHAQSLSFAFRYGRGYQSDHEKVRI